MRYAVVYGAGSRVGQAYCKLLVEQGFGLILVDFSYDRLLQTELHLTNTLKQQLIIKMIVVKPGEEMSQLLEESLQTLDNFSIWCFVNAKCYETGDSDLVK